MAIPSGSGTEVLKNTTIKTQSNSETAVRWDGTRATTGTSTYSVPTNHIITVLSIVFCEVANATGGELLTVRLDDGTDNVYVLNQQSIPAYGTFTWNDRVVIASGNKLKINLASAGNVDIWVSYIDQDWT